MCEVLSEIRYHIAFLLKWHYPKLTDINHNYTVFPTLVKSCANLLISEFYALTVVFVRSSA